MYKKIGLVFSFLLFTHVNAHALVLPSACLTSNNPDVCVTETDTGSGGVYEITNNGAQRIYGFAVSNSDTLSAYTFQPNWIGMVLTKEDWDEPGRAMIFYESPSVSRSLSMSSLGSFESLFGTTENKVNLYWNWLYGYPGTVPLENGQALGDFFWEFGEPASNMIAFGLDGKIIASSILAVPEPETYAMMLAGLGLVGFSARRKFN